MSSAGQWDPQNQISLGDAFFPSSMNEHDSVGLPSPLKDSVLRMLAPLAKWMSKSRYHLLENAVFRTGQQVGPQLTCFFLSNSIRTLAGAAKFRSEGALARGLAGGSN